MSNQKHTVSTDALDTLGTCPIPENSGRDAIHLAVEPAIAGQLLMAGDRVKIVDGVAVARVNNGDSDDATGIVDPFLVRPGFVEKGQKFWFVVLPRTITSLRHVWSHPAFPEAAEYHKDEMDEHYFLQHDEREIGSVPVDVSNNVSRADMTRFLSEIKDNRPSVPAPEPVESMAKAWMRDYCAEIGERYEYIMEGAKRFLERGEYTYGEKDSGNLEGVDVPAEFWERYHAITKEDVNVRSDDGFFSCSC